MLNATFQCFRGIGEAGERRLWQIGCLCWRDFRHGGAHCLSLDKQRLVADQLQEAECALAAGAADWFVNRLKGAAALRVLGDFFKNTLFLDIETTGLDNFAKVTSIATWKNGEAKCFIRDINLTDFLYELPGTILIATYNGKQFDLPFLRREFGIDLLHPHLDLMYPLRSLGLRGGLKTCERTLGFRRQYSTGTDGLEAIKLWSAWQMEKDREALRKLAVYNVEDTYSLAWMAARVIGQTMNGYPFVMKMPLPDTPTMRNILAPFAL